MQRTNTGSYITSAVAGEEVRSFIPNPLPPSPSVRVEDEVLESLAEAMLALGRLDAASLHLPDPDLFVYAYVRKEAVLSSQIEGTQSSLSELLQYELAETPAGLTDDVVEVSNYVAALEHGLKRMRDGFPLSNRLIREIHGVLLSRGRGSGKMPGEFRRSQVWIGGSRPGNAVFVPPPHTYVEDCMGALEFFLHTEDDGIPPLVRAGLAHVQFETIHPFLDGNGRVGRLLITFMLCHAGILSDPVLYLSLYFKRNRMRYYELLNEVRLTGDWEAWLMFFLDGVRETAEDAYLQYEKLKSIFETHRKQIENHGRRAGSALRVQEALTKRPVLSLGEASNRAGLSFSATSSAMTLLTEIGIAREITNARRGRLYVYDEYLSILSEGTELE